MVYLVLPGNGTLQGIIGSFNRITNLVPRATAAADELTPGELVQGAALLSRKVRRRRPRFVAFLGVGVYRTAFGRPRAALGLQKEKVAGAGTWVLPNPSGLNAHYQLPHLARLYAELRQAAERREEDGE
jgi:TDG/mug DNA glycosylase family protein